MFLTQDSGAESIRTKNSFVSHENDNHAVNRPNTVLQQVIETEHLTRTRLSQTLSPILRTDTKDVPLEGQPCSSKMSTCKTEISSIFANRTKESLSGKRTVSKSERDKEFTKIADWN